MFSGAGEAKAETTVSDELRRKGGAGQTLLKYDVL